MIQLLGPRLLVRRSEPAASKSVIEIVEFSKEPSRFGEIVAVGNGERLPNGARRPIPLKKGDRVILGRYSGVEVEVDGEALVVVMESDVLAVDSDKL